MEKQIREDGYYRITTITVPIGLGGRISIWKKMGLRWNIWLTSTGEWGAGCNDDLMKVREEHKIYKFAEININQLQFYQAIL